MKLGHTSRLLVMRKVKKPRIFGRVMHALDVLIPIWVVADPLFFGAGAG